MNDWSWGQTRVLVTGGAGFIGSHLAETLVEKGANVRVLDNFSTGRLENLKSVAGRVTIIHGDLRDDQVLKEAVEGCDFVFHQAAIASVVFSFEDPLTTNEVNCTGTWKLLIQCKKQKVQRVVLASSCAVYGNCEILPLSEDLTPLPASPYALSKLLMEQIALFAFRVMNLETVCLRYFNIYGPRQDRRSSYAAVIPRFIEALLSGRRPVIYGDGSQTRDFLFVGACMCANLLACLSDKAAGSILNIRFGSRHSIRDLLSQLQKIIGVETEPIYEDFRLGDVLHSLSDLRAAEKTIGFRPTTSLEDGHRKTINWFCKQMVE
ncbi:MAG: SDR family NAD(P)-dependent oxidoreductase [Armatimonadetes bacterium]|nr:SDR family NAD(P)-dependent oxidoreductase [Armatimonadota bacterium]MDW8122927.1 SDR family NAD(P)-dependent oxidoreductase [Armatimonadota bacterium]